MTKLNKIDNFIKHNIRKCRAKGIPLVLGKDKIALGNILIVKANNVVLVDDLRNDKKISLNFIYSAILLAKYIDIGMKPASVNYKAIIDYDRKLAKYAYDSKIYNQKLRRTKNFHKLGLYENKIDHAQQQFSYWLARLYSLDKWDYQINKTYKFEDYNET